LLAVLRRLPPFVLAVAAAAALAACGGTDKRARTTTQRHPTSPHANAAYEQAYTECASTPLRRLATTYAVAVNPRAVVRAVGAGWAKRLGAGTEGIRLGEAGCRDGFDSRTGGT
jgi:type IV pilus biogenesis protein CpaD/CtpE